MKLKNIKSEINTVKEELDYTKIKITSSNPMHLGMKLAYFRIDNFDQFFKYIHIKFNSTKSIKLKTSLIELEQYLYTTLIFCIKIFNKNIQQKKVDIIFEDNQEYNSEIKNIGKQFFKIDKRKTTEYHLYKIINIRLKIQLKEAEEKIYLLKHFKFPLYNNEEHLGRPFDLRFKKETIIYKGISLGYTKYSASILSNETHKSKEKTELLNLMAFFQCEPNFLLTNNKYYNSRLENLYSNFDITDLLFLSKKDFFKTRQNNLKTINTPIFKLKSNSNIVILPELLFPEILSLYHSTLKQIEPLPRCVFLFRIIDYAKNYLYQKEFKKSDTSIMEIVEYYYAKALKHNFIPLYYFDDGYDYTENSRVKKRKERFRNFISDLKLQSKNIIKNWEKNQYLKSMKLGNIIYNTGRNAVAHGANGRHGRHNTNYNYSTKYLHINNVNIFLELISRYIIEVTNPDLRKIIETKIAMYKLNSGE